MSRSGQEILAICRLHLGDEDAEALVCWLAARLGRPSALAGDRPAHQRLEHVVAHWMSEGQRSALLSWLARRAALGRALVPGRASDLSDGRARPRGPAPGRSAGG